MIDVIIIIAPIFIIIFTVALIQKFTNIGKDWEKVLNEYALKVGLPVLIFSALSKVSFSFEKEGYLIVVNSFLLIFSFAIILLLKKFLFISEKKFSTIFICFTFGNVAYLGIPVLIQIKGANILAEASLIAAIYLSSLFIIGVGYLEFVSKKNEDKIIQKTIKGLLQNPLLVAVFLGILIGNLEITIPSIVVKSLDMISASVTPIVLTVIGLFIGSSNFGKLTNWIPVLFFSIFTLFIFPTILFLLIIFLNFDLSQFSSSIIQAAMPLGITPFALADKYNLHKNFVARAIILSTILSVLSLPFWIYFLQSL